MELVRANRVDQARIGCEDIRLFIDRFFSAVRLDVTDHPMEANNSMTHLIVVVIALAICLSTRMIKI